MISDHQWYHVVRGRVEDGARFHCFHRCFCFVLITLLSVGVVTVTWLYSRPQCLVDTRVQNNLLLGSCDALADDIAHTADLDSHVLVTQGPPGRLSPQYPPFPV